MRHGGNLVWDGVLRVTGIGAGYRAESGMSVKINRSGLDKLMKNAKELQATKQVKLVDLMNPTFIAAHSNFEDLGALFAASGFKVDSAEDFAAIPDAEWDAFISENTDFDNWLEMQKAAHAEFAKSILNKGL